MPPKCNPERDPERDLEAQCAVLPGALSGPSPFPLPSPSSAMQPCTPAGASAGASAETRHSPQCETRLPTPSETPSESSLDVASDVAPDVAPDTECVPAVPSRRFGDADVRVGAEVHEWLHTLQRRFTQGTSGVMRGALPRDQLLYDALVAAMAASAARALALLQSALLLASLTLSAFMTAFALPPRPSQLHWLTVRGFAMLLVALYAVACLAHSCVRLRRFARACNALTDATVLALFGTQPRVSPTGVNALLYLLAAQLLAYGVLCTTWVLT